MWTSRRIQFIVRNISMLLNTSIREISWLYNIYDWSDCSGYLKIHILKDFLAFITQEMELCSNEFCHMCFCADNQIHSQKHQRHPYGQRFPYLCLNHRISVCGSPCTGLDLLIWRQTQRWLWHSKMKHNRLNNFVWN